MTDEIKTTLSTTFTPLLLPTRVSLHFPSHLPPRMLSFRSSCDYSSACLYFSIRFKQSCHKRLDFKLVGSECVCQIVHTTYTPGMSCEFKNVLNRLSWTRFYHTMFTLDCPYLIVEHGLTIGRGLVQNIKAVQVWWILLPTFSFTALCQYTKYLVL